jgi:hypothetical protein
MTGPLVTVRLDGRRHGYRPGEKLSGEYRVDTANPDAIKAIELSVLWHTEGKGDEDLGVHFFERVSAEEHPTFDPHQTFRFSTRLPNTPLSYDGRIVKIRWCVRVRVFLPRGETLVHEEPFQLGAVPAPVVEETPASE